MIISEGEYNNGKRDRNEIDYYHNEIIKYESTYLNGKKMEQKKIL